MKRLISLFITLIIGFILYYLFLPPINLSSFGFWIFLFVLIIIYCTLSLLYFIYQFYT